MFSARYCMKTFKEFVEAIGQPPGQPQPGQPRQGLGGLQPAGQGFTRRLGVRQQQPTTEIPTDAINTVFNRLSVQDTGKAMAYVTQVIQDADPATKAAIKDPTTQDAEIAKIVADYQQRMVPAQQTTAGGEEVSSGSTGLTQWKQDAQGNWVRG